MRPSRYVSLFSLIAVSFAWAQTPDLIPVRVVFGPIDDGSYHIIVLVDDGKPCPTPHEVQGPGAHNGFVMNQFKNPQGVWVSSMGCWESSIDGTARVEYMDPSASSLWHQFTLSMPETQQMTWEWRRERFLLTEPLTMRHSEPTAAVAQTPQSEARLAGPSFDCTKARSMTEKLICADGELAAQDLVYARLYQRALAKASSTDAFLRDGRQQLKDRETKCFDKACLLEWYAKRTATLTAVAE